MVRTPSPELVAAAGLAALISAGPVGCKRRVPPLEDAEPPPSAARIGPVSEPTRCVEVERGAVFTVGEGDAAGGEDEEAKGLPFAIEIGGASAWADGFVVGAQRAKDGATSALLALTGEDASDGRIVELGAVHGNVGTPRVAARGKDIIAAVPDGDGTGIRLRLCAIREPAARADVVWGAEVAQGQGDSDEFDLALGERAGLLVWDDWASTSGQSQIKAVTFDVGDVAKATKPRVISEPKSDVEGPQLAVRPGGFWLAFIAHEAEKSRKPGERSAPKPDEDEIGGSVVELGKRWLKVVGLDHNGSPTGAPVGVTAEEMHVLVFDLATLPDGAALLTWRNDDTSPGVEGGTVHLARVTPDGAVSRSAVEARDVGAGVPGLVVDAKQGASGVWLAMAGVWDDTALGALGRDGRSIDELMPDPLVKSAEPLALADGRLLIVRPKGLAAELSVVRCRPGARRSTPTAPVHESPLPDDELPRGLPAEP